MKIGRIICTALIVAMSLVSCTKERGSVYGGKAVLTIAIQARTTESSSGLITPWENRIDVAGGDFRVYLFTYGDDDENGGSLFAELSPTDIHTANTLGSTKYVITGEVRGKATYHSAFKVVALAGWGDYPEVVAGLTTIDDLCEGEAFSMYDAEGFLYGEDGGHYIPFYGVREYTGVVWDRDGVTDLSSTGVTLLRALAKVEVSRIDESVAEFSSVSIVRYNSAGYCAPKEVYLSGDYDHGGEDSQDFTTSLHLVGGGNDGGVKIFDFNKTGDDTWVIYLPEYDNSGSDYTYINVSFTDSSIYPKVIFFGNYSDGVCSAYERGGNPDDRFDLYRNYCYNFSVSSLNSFSADSTPQNSLPTSDFKVRLHRTDLSICE